MTLRVFNRTIDKSRYSTTFLAKKIIVKKTKTGTYHIDGEPHESKEDFIFEIKESALNVLV